MRYRVLSDYSTGVECSPDNAHCIIVDLKEEAVVARYYRDTADGTRRERAQRFADRLNAKEDTQHES